jgi:hypothetical protein
VVGLSDPVWAVVGDKLARGVGASGGMGTGGDHGLSVGEEDDCGKGGLVGLWVGDGDGVGDLVDAILVVGDTEDLGECEGSSTGVKSNKEESVSPAASGSVDEKDMPTMRATTATVAVRIMRAQIPAANVFLCFREAMLDFSSSMYFREHSTGKPSSGLASASLSSEVDFGSISEVDFGLIILFQFYAIFVLCSHRPIG